MFENQKTDAFKRFIDKKFVSRFDDYITWHYNLEDQDAEIDLWCAMCRYYNDKIQDKFDFYQVKQQYKYNMAHISPNLDVIQKNKVVKREQDKLEAFARIKYSNDDIKSHSYELIPLMYLFSIYSKLNKKNLNDIASSAVGQYLLYAGMECGINFPHILIDMPLVQQATNLHNSIAVFDYRLANMEYLIDRGNSYPIICVNRTFKDNYNIDLTPEELEEFEDLNEDDQVVFINNKNFHERLINEMHTLDNGMKF